MVRDGDGDGDGEEGEGVGGGESWGGWRGGEGGAVIWLVGAYISGLGQFRTRTEEGVGVGVGVDVGGTRLWCSGYM